jgi:hypothetical protein
VRVSEYHGFTGAFNGSVIFHAEIFATSNPGKPGSILSAPVPPTFYERHRSPETFWLELRLHNIMISAYNAVRLDERRDWVVSQFEPVSGLQ